MKIRDLVDEIEFEELEMMKIRAHGGIILNAVDILLILC